MGADDYIRPREDLERELISQVGFLERSAAAYDTGQEDEAKRLASAIRILVYDRGRSRSILGQLGVKDSMAFIDTGESIRPQNLAPTTGLVSMRGQVREDGTAAGTYVPRCKRPPSPVEGMTWRRFDHWWSNAAAKDRLGETFSRADFVLTVANQDGGAHVDPSLKKTYAALTRENSMGFHTTRTPDGGFGFGVSIALHGHPTPPPGEDEVAFTNNFAFASVRQIAHEVTRSIRRELPNLLEIPPVERELKAEELKGTGRNDPCPCGSGLKHKKCHGAPGTRRT